MVVMKSKTRDYNLSILQEAFGSFVDFSELDVGMKFLLIKEKTIRLQLLFSMAERRIKVMI